MTWREDLDGAEQALSWASSIPEADWAESQVLPPSFSASVVAIARLRVRLERADRIEEAAQRLVDGRTPIWGDEGVYQEILAALASSPDREGDDEEGTT